MVFSHLSKTHLTLVTKLKSEVSAVLKLERKILKSDAILRLATRLKYLLRMYLTLSLVKRLKSF